MIQWSGYCLVQAGHVVGKSPTGTVYLRTLICTSVVLFILGVFFPSSGIGSGSNGLSQDREFGPLSSFLQSKGISVNQTIYLTMASKEYIDPVINFKKQLDKFDLGDVYVVLCLDPECVDATKAHHILGFGGYLATETEAEGDWHFPIARMKVPPPTIGLNVDSLLPTWIY